MAGSRRLLPNKTDICSITETKPATYSFSRCLGGAGSTILGRRRFLNADITDAVGFLMIRTPCALGTGLPLSGIPKGRSPLAARRVNALRAEWLYEERF